MKKNAARVSAALIALFVLGGIAFLDISRQLTQEVEAVRQEIPVIAGISVREAMVAHASSTGFLFEEEFYPDLGYFIESIGGIRNGNGYYWTLYLNGSYSPIGASQAILRPEDRVEWVYEKR